jgi:hypothetical protein
MKILLLIAFIAVFFEAGLISSYTIVTSQPPDIGNLLGMQVDELSSLLNFGSGSSIITNPTTVPINNAADVANALQSTSGLDGINLQSLSAQISGSSKATIFPVNITAIGYKYAISGSNSSQIIITPNETYSITASGTATKQAGKLVIDVTSLQITSSRKLYGTTNST